MNEEILQKSQNVKKAYDNDRRVLLLNELEKKLNDNEEVMALAYQKDIAVDRYSDLLKIYAPDSEEIKKAQKEMSEAKEKLYAYPLVKEYLKAYQDVRNLNDEINNILFKDFNVFCKEGHN